MARAPWEGLALAASDGGIVAEGDHWFSPDFPKQHWKTVEEVRRVVVER